MKKYYIKGILTISLVCIAEMIVEYIHFPLFSWDNELPMLILRMVSYTIFAFGMGAITYSAVFFWGWLSEQRMSIAVGVIWGLLLILYTMGAILVHKHSHFGYCYNDSYFEKVIWKDSFQESLSFIVFAIYSFIGCRIGYIYRVHEERKEFFGER